MKRRALLIGNSNGLPGVQIDLKNIQSFLYSKQGGAWNVDEIFTLPNATKEELEEHVYRVKVNNTDYCIVYFSGHGGFQRQTILELSDKSIIHENLLFNLASRQLTIFDCCRCIVPEAIFESAALSTESINFADSDREYFRRKYSTRIMQAIPQQAKLYSCSVDEISNDEERKGGVYTQALLEATKYYQTVGEVHQFAGRLIDSRWNSTHSESEQQHPDAVLPKCLTSQQLIISQKLD